MQDPRAQTQLFRLENKCVFPVSLLDGPKVGPLSSAFLCLKMPKSSIKEGGREEGRGGKEREEKVLFQFIVKEGRVQLMLLRADSYFLVSSTLSPDTSTLIGFPFARRG